MMTGTMSWMGQTAGWTIADAKEAAEIAQATTKTAKTDGDKELAQEGVDLAARILDEVETAQQRRADGGENHRCRRFVSVCAGYESIHVGKTQFSGSHRRVPEERERERESNVCR